MIDGKPYGHKILNPAVKLHRDLQNLDDISIDCSEETCPTRKRERVNSVLVYTGNTIIAGVAYTCNVYVKRIADAITNWCVRCEINPQK